MSSIRARGGKLIFDFTYKGIRCRETTKMKDFHADFHNYFCISNSPQAPTKQRIRLITVGL